ncbi:MAG: isoaspartyl peptidase/L-asparaginase [Cyanobacteriota bacterium]|nr:isoaspartyl peptidase/L-asparaginase [Cyanobacteriota bacterium]
MSQSQVSPKLIIHGGAGSSLSGKGGVEIVRKSLYRVIEEVYKFLQEGGTAMDAVVRGCQLLEDDPLFNAGTGSVLQSDGQIRMSASLMDGANQRFSGTINVSRVQHPIELAQTLQEQSDRVLSDWGSAEFARDLSIPVFDPMTDKRLKEWLQDRDENFDRAMANVVAESAGRGTIGVVALDSQGQLAVGTSTGGKGFERIGRVSDSAMPAGNYANANAAVSCTGIGEDIIDECLAAKIVVRVTDGLSLEEAMERSIAESDRNGRDLGAIALDSTGAIAWGKTSEVILAAFHDGEHIGDTLEATKETATSTF